MNLIRISCFVSSALLVIIPAPAYGQMGEYQEIWEELDCDNLTSTTIDVYAGEPPVLVWSGAQRDACEFIEDQAAADCNVPVFLCPVNQPCEVGDKSGVCDKTEPIPDHDQKCFCDTPGISANLLLTIGAFLSTLLLSRRVLLDHT